MIMTLLLSFTVFAYDTTYIEEKINIKDIYDSLPEEVLENIDRSLFDNDDIVKSAENITSDSVIDYVTNTLVNMLFPALKSFAALFSLIIITSLINTSKNTIASESLSKTVSFITTIALCVIAFETVKSSGIYVETFLKSMDNLINALLPVMTLLYTLGGNAASSIVNSMGISFTLTLFNFIIQHLVTPVLKICFGLTIAGEVGALKGVTQITKTIKIIITVLLSAVITIFSIFLLFKTNLSVASDSVAARTVKFAGSFIPVIGSPLGESVRSIMSGLSLIKSSTGYIGIIIVFLLTVPTVLQLILTKFSLELSSSLAHILGSEKEGNILKEFASLFNYLLAITVSVVILFLFELIVFVTISPALGGS